jgi:hypothetical protein
MAIVARTAKKMWSNFIPIAVVRLEIYGGINVLGRGGAYS